MRKKSTSVSPFYSYFFYTFFCFFFLYFVFCMQKWKNRAKTWLRCILTFTTNLFLISLWCFRIDFNSLSVWLVSISTWPYQAFIPFYSLIQIQLKICLKQHVLFFRILYHSIHTTPKSLMVLLLKKKNTHIAFGKNDFYFTWKNLQYVRATMLIYYLGTENNFNQCGILSSFLI